MTTTRRGRLAASGFIACWLAACGGDGDSTQVTMDKQSADFATVNGSGASETVAFAMSRAQSGTLYGAASSDGVEFDAVFQPQSNLSATVTLTLHQPQSTALQPGDHSGNLTFELCADSACAGTPIWSGKLPYTVHAFSMPTDPVVIVAGLGPPATASIPITPPDTGHLLTFSADNAGSWLQVTHDDPASVTITVLTNTGLQGASGNVIGPNTLIPIYWSTPSPN
jgi:hypothetical protein